MSAPLFTAARARGVVEALERRDLFAVPNVSLSLANSLGSETTLTDPVFTVSRTGGDLSLPMTVQFTLAGSATRGVDYVSPGTEVTVPAGASWTHLPIRVLDDAVAEGNETVTVRLSPSAQYVLTGSGALAATIRDRSNRDVREPNDTRAQASLLGGGTSFQELALSLHQPGDQDYLLFVDENAPRVPLEVRIAFDHAAGDLGLAVYTENGVLVGRSQTGGNVERVVVPPDNSRNVYVAHVYGESGAMNPVYNLNINPVRSGPALLAQVGAQAANVARFTGVYPGEASAVKATLVNVGDQPLELGAVTAPAGFEVVGQPPAVLAPGESALLDLRFTGRDAPGVYTGELSFATNGAGGNHVVPLTAPVYGMTRRTFLYNNSAFDGNNPRHTVADHAALDETKRGLLPGETPSAANVSSYTKGINGVMLTVVRPVGRAITPDDFELRFAAADGTSWAPAPGSVNTYAWHAGNGVYNVSLIWPDHNPAAVQVGQAVSNGWLEVKVKANENTGLLSQDVFYFGHLTGETGDASSPLRVGPVDYLLTRRAVGSTAGVSNRYDFNRDGRVSPQDVAVVRSALGRSLPPPPRVAAAVQVALAPAGSEEESEDPLA